MIQQKKSNIIKKEKSMNKEQLIDQLNETAIMTITTTNITEIEQQ